MNGAARLRESRLRTLDRRFARWVRESFIAGQPEAGEGELIEQLAAAVSHALHLKHGCLDLTRLGELGEPVLEDLLAGIVPADLRALPADHPAIGTRPGAAPLLRSEDGQRVWLQKYAGFERTVAERVTALAKRAPAPISDAQTAALERLYPTGESRFADQRRATELALGRALAVIAGGPGTGKTWTVAAIIGLLLQADPHLRIALAAPTGKAANRVMESLREAARDELFADLFRSRSEEGELPAAARTLHALLEVGYHSVKPRRNRDRPLDCDVLVVDEASMVDLPMMARVLDALPEHGRLILLGDKDQLASVEAGGVLADLCLSGAASVYGGAEAPVAELTHNHRSTAAIQSLAEAVKESSWKSPGTNSEVRVHSLEPGAHGGQSPGWLAGALAHHRSLAERIEAGADIEALLAQLGAFQMLCALRAGPAGVEGINRRLERTLGADYRRRTGRDPERGGRPWFPGLPVIVLRNDHERRLYNGDLGLVLPVTGPRDDPGNEWGNGSGNESGNDGRWRLHTDPESAFEADPAELLRACFPLASSAGGANVKAVSLAQMPPFESAYALTVHKSQGSEYQRVSLLLPDDVNFVRNHPVLTRELLYTGITRAKQTLDLWAGAGVPEAMARRRTVRMSGLTPQQPTAVEAISEP